MSADIPDDFEGHRQLLQYRASRRLAAIVESSDDAIVSKDLNGIVTSWNRSAERLFGYSAAEMIGQSIRVIIPPDKQGEEDVVLAKVRKGEKIDHFETVRMRKDGTLLDISLTVSPIRDDDGTVIGASKIARDITQAKAAEAERQRLLSIAEEAADENARLYAELQEANRLKDEFLATLSHELRTPLNAILGYARMLRAGIVPADRQPRAVETIERNAKSLTQIVEDVLDVSRIISGKLRLDIQMVDLTGVVRQAVDTVLPAADAKGIRIETAIDGKLAPISGDPERLQQIVWNLMSNAVKFTGRGGRIDVRLERVGSQAEIVVADSGIGISADFLPHIFERFRQADSGSNRQRGGLGLGLAISRQLVEMHGGTIHASSGGAGLGSTFRVSLPITISQRDSASSFVGSDGALAPQLRSSLQGVSVVAVDDDRDAIELVRDILESGGAQVTTASSAPEALDLLQRLHPDVLVADLGLPLVDGFDLIKRVRALDDPVARGVPAAALTAYARSEDRSKALRSGYQMHLAKPIDPAELIAAVVALVQRPRGAETAAAHLS